MSQPRPSFAERRERRAAVDDPEIVMAAAAAFLAARPRSVAEVRRRLRELGYRIEMIEAVLERLVELGYLDDETFARAWIESRDRARPRGERALRHELARKGIDRQTIDAVLAERAAPEPVVASAERGGPPARETGSAAAAGSADELAARRLLERRRRSLMREPDQTKRRQKAYALMARHGFDPELAREAVSWFEDLLASLEDPSAGDGPGA